MSDMRFTKEHEWISVEGDTATVGITDHAQDQLGDITFVELPEPGKRVEKGGEVAAVDSVKAASEVYAPVSGEVIEVNKALDENAALVNDAPEGEGWFFKMRIADKAELDDLMTREAYEAYLKELA